MNCIKFSVDGKEYQFRVNDESKLMEEFISSIKTLKQQLLEDKTDKGVDFLATNPLTNKIEPIRIKALHQIKPIQGVVKQAEIQPVTLENKVQEVTIEELLQRFGVNNLESKLKNIEDRRLKEMFDLDMSYGEDGALLWEGVETESGIENTPEYKAKYKQIQDKYDAEIAILNQLSEQTTNQTQSESQNGQTIEEIYNQLGNKTQSENIVLPQDLETQYTNATDFNNKIVPLFLREYSDGIIAFRGRKSNNRIGNPFNWQDETGTNQEKATKATLKFIDGVLNPSDYGSLEKELQTIQDLIKSGNLKGKKILYYDEMLYPTHATALDWLINNSNSPFNQTQQSNQPVNTIEQLTNNPNFIDYIKENNITTDNQELNNFINQIRTQYTTNKADDEVVVTPQSNEVNEEEIVEEVFNQNLSEKIEPVEHDGVEPQQDLKDFIESVKDEKLKEYLQIISRKFENVKIQYKSNIDTEGQYSLTNPDLIVVNANADENKRAEIVLHELIHKATIVDYLLDRGKQNTSSIAFDNLFDDFINQIKKGSKAKYDKYLKESNGGIKEINDFIEASEKGDVSDDIKIKAVAEFIAYGMSDLQFKKLINTITTNVGTQKTKDESLLKKLKDIISSLLERIGLSKANTILNKLIDNVSFVLDKEGFVIDEIKNDWKEIILNKDKPVTDKIPHYLNFGARKTLKRYTDNLSRIKEVMTDEQYKWFKYDVSYSNLVVNDNNINELEQGDMIKVPKYEAIKDKNGNVTEFKTKITNGELETRWEVVVKKYGNMIATIDEFGNTRTRIIKRDNEFEIKGIKKFIRPFVKTNVDLDKYYKDNHTSYKNPDSTFIAGDNVKVMKGSTISYNTNFKMKDGKEFIGTGVVTANYGNMVEVVVKGKTKHFTKLIPTNTIRNVYYKKDVMTEIIKKQKDKAGINLEATKLDISGVSVKKTNIAFDKSNELIGEAYKSALNKHWNKLEAGDMVVVKSSDDNGVFQFPATIIAKTTAKGREGILIQHKSPKNDKSGLLEFVKKEELETGKSKFKILNYYENPYEISEVYSTFMSNINFVDSKGKDYKNFNKNYDIYDFGITSDNPIANEKYKNINNKTMLNKVKQGDILNVEFEIDNNGKKEKRSQYEVVLEVTDEYYMTVKEANLWNEKTQKKEPYFMKKKYYKNNPEQIAEILGVGFARQTDNYHDDMIELLPLLKNDFIKNPLFEQRLNGKYEVENGEVKHKSKKYADKQPFKATHFDSSSVTNGSSVIDKNGVKKENVSVTNAEKFFASRGDIVMYQYVETDENNKPELDKEGKPITKNALALVVHNRNNRMVLATNIKDKNNNDIKLENMDEKKLLDVFNKLENGEYSVITYDKKYDEILTVYFRNYKYSDDFVKKLRDAAGAEKGNKTGVVKLNYSNPKSASIKAAKKFGLKESLDKYNVMNVLKAKYDISDLEYPNLNVRDEILKVYPLADLNELSGDELHFLDVGTLEKLEKTNWYSDLISRNTIPLLDLEFETNEELYDYLEKRGVKSHKQLENYIEKERVKSKFNQLIESGLLTMYC